MFETATLAGGLPGKRVWTTCVGITGEALLVVFAMIAPMVWPQVLPKAQLTTWLAPPSPPTPPPPVGRPAVRPRETVHHTVQFHDPQIYAYTHMPPHPVILSDPPDMGSSGPGVIGAVPGEARDGVPTGLVDSLLRDSAPPPPQVAPPPVPKPVDRPITRMTLGGNVLMGRLIRRVEPVYPRIAIQARVSGEVRLEAVVGPDGRVRELQVKSGHPLLVRAAVEAVSQWVFQPTLLNGDPVEVSAPVTVTFRLGQ